MRAIEHDSPGTGVSPHRKQQRSERSNQVTTRGRVPVLSPFLPRAEDASCSPAGRVDGRQQAIDAEVSQIWADARPVMPINEHQRIDWLITAVLASTG